MSRFRNVETGVVFSVDDSKNERYASELYGDPDAAPDQEPAKRGPGRPRKTD